MSDKNILEVYKKRVYNELLIEKRAKIEEIKNNDPVVKACNKAVEELKKVLADNGIENYVSFGIENGKLVTEYHVLTEDTRKAIEETEVAFKDKMDDRDRIVEEVTARLMAVESYEQEMAIYEKYGIIDKETGKIYDYKK